VQINQEFPLEVFLIDLPAFLEISTFIYQVCSFS